MVAGVGPHPLRCMPYSLQLAFTRTVVSQLNDPREAC